MHNRELAKVLLRKAQQDEFALEKPVPDPASPIEVIGLHAQQAIEKMLKAVLNLALVRYGRTHDILKLLDLLRQNRISFPSELLDVTRLTPFAAVFRYAEMAPQTQQPFEASWALDRVRKVRTWAESVLREQPGR